LSRAGAAPPPGQAYVGRTLQAPRWLRMYDRLTGPSRTQYIAMPCREPAGSGTSFEVYQGDAHFCAA
jgi:hypothetical protein